MKKITRLLSVLLCIFCAMGCGSVKDRESKASIPQTSLGMYAYECLKDKEKAVYDAMVYALNNHIEKIEVETIDDEAMKKAFFYVLKDHPEIFWCNSFNRYSSKYSDGTVKTEFEPIYTLTKKERYNYQEQIDKVADSWLASIPSDADDYTKAKVIFDILASQVKYATDSAENQNIISVFINKQSVCQGYSKAFQYLLSKVGIESSLVRGESRGSAHAWNLVKLDGDYYYFDVTWATPSFDEDNENESFINYSYFAVTTDEIQTEHVITDDLPLPICTATRDNYFVKERLLFDTNNPNIVGDAIYNASVSKNSFVSLKFTTDELYSWAAKYFITDRHVFEFYKISQKLYMLYNDNLRVISLIFNYS